MPKGIDIPYYSIYNPTLDIFIGNSQDNFGKFFLYDINNKKNRWVDYNDPDEKKWGDFKGIKFGAAITLKPNEAIYLAYFIRNKIEKYDFSGNLLNSYTFSDITYNEPVPKKGEWFDREKTLNCFRETHWSENYKLLFSSFSGKQPGKPQRNSSLFFAHNSNLDLIKIWEINKPMKSFCILKDLNKVAVLPYNNDDYIYLYDLKK